MNPYYQRQEDSVRMCCVTATLYVRYSSTSNISKTVQDRAILTMPE